MPEVRPRRSPVLVAAKYRRIQCPGGLDSALRQGGAGSGNHAACSQCPGWEPTVADADAELGRGAQVEVGGGVVGGVEVEVAEQSRQPAGEPAQFCACGGRLSEAEHCGDRRPAAMDLGGEQAGGNAL